MDGSRAAIAGAPAVLTLTKQNAPRARRENEMNWDQIEGMWKQFTGSAKERWGKFTDDDMQTLTGQKEHLVGKIQERYGIAREEAEKQAEAWSATLKAARQEATKAHV